MYGVQMTEEVAVPEVNAEPSVDYKALYEQSQAEIKALAAKKDELLTETKKAKADRLAAEQAAKNAEMEKARKDGEYEKLWQAEAENRKALEQQLNDYKNNIKQEKILNNSMRLAAEMAEGDNVELLADFVSRKLASLADDTGAVDNKVLEAVKADFENNKKYASLMRQSKATGGGAPGQISSANKDAKVVDRATFAQWDSAKQHKFIMQDRGTLKD